jgi:hypothetical protein
VVLGSSGARIATKRGGSWSTEELSNDPPGLTFAYSFLVGADDREVVYGDFGLTGSVLGFVWRVPGGTWQGPESLKVPSSANTIGAAVAIDSAGHVWAAFVNRTNVELSRSDALGQPNAVVARQVAPDVTLGLAFDSADRPWLRVGDAIASVAGSTWTLTPTPTLPGFGSQLFVDPGGRACVAFVASGALHAACLDGGVVADEIVNAAVSAIWVRAALVSMGHAHFLLGSASGSPVFYLGPGGLRELGAWRSAQLTVSAGVATVFVQDDASGRVLELR